jgi:hypothetical protein
MVNEGIPSTVGIGVMGLLRFTGARVDCAAILYLT